MERMHIFKEKFRSRLIPLVLSNSPLSYVLLMVLALIFSFSLSSLSIEPLETLEERIGALPWTIAPDDSTEERVTIVAIDEKSLERIGPWPWSRAVMAELTDKIFEAGAQVQIHDIVYPPGVSGDERIFADALGAEGRGIMAQLPILEAQDTPIQSGIITHPLTGLSCEGSALLTADSYLGSSGIFRDVAKGHITPIIDSDGAVRKVPAVICVSGNALPALAIAPLLELAGGSEWEASMSEDSGFLKSTKTLSLGPFSSFAIPLDSKGNFRISFRKSPSAFRSISAIDIVDGNFEGSILENGLVLVGATAFGLDDIVPTPFSGSTPGVELQARALTSILDAQVPYEPSGRPVILAIICLFFGGLLSICASVRGRVALVGLPTLAVSTPLISLVIHGVLLTGYGLWLGWLLPGLFGFVAGLSLLVIELARVRFERSRVMMNLNSYLPAETARKVAFELPSSQIQAERTNVTLLCADLRNFSALGEKRPPEESASVLHYFFMKVNSVVEQHGGRVHEYKGDGVLAIWDGDGQNSAARALAAALQIDKEVNDNLLPEIGVQGLEPLAVGIGIEQGPVLLGSIGPAHRRAHTLCGETVSVTLRIQEMTADLASPVIVGEVAARYISDVKLESLGHFLLPGLVTTHVLYAPSSLHSSARENLTLLVGGLE